MKLILCVLFMLISAKDCDTNKAQTPNGNPSDTVIVQSEGKIQDQTKITYQAATRGFFMTVWVEGDSIMTSDDNTLKVVNAYPFPKEEKETFLKLFHDVDKMALPELEPPTKKFQYDAAPMAWLEVLEGETSYKTMIFDHGKPPEAIQKLVEKILSLKTMVEKQ